MPKIKEYGAPELAFQASGVSSSSELEFTGAIGESMQRFGKQFEDIGAAVERRDEQAQVSQFNAAIAEARANWEQRLDQQIQSGSVDTEKNKQQLQEELGKLGDGIDNPRAKQMFEQESARLKGHVLISSAKGQAKVAGDNAILAHESELNASKKILFRKPGEFDEVLAASMRSVDRDVESGIIRDPMVAKKLREETAADLAEFAARGQIRTNPYAAKKDIEAKYAQHLSAERMDQLYRSADGEIKSRQDQFERTMALKDKDPWKFVTTVGDTKGLKSLSLGEDAPESFKDRLEFQERVEAKHGIKLPFLSDKEVDSFISKVDSQSPEQTAQMLSSVTDKINPSLWAKVGEQVAKKEPGLGAAFSIAGESPEDARRIIAGMRLLRKGGTGDGAAIRPPPTADVERQFDSYMGSAVEHSGVRIAARQAIVNHMVSSKFDRGEKSFDSFSTSDFEESARAVLGPKASINGQETLSFRGKSGQFLNADELPDLIDGLTDETVNAVQGDVPRTLSGEPVNLEKSQGRITLKVVKDGQYYLYVDSKPTFRADKKAFVLNLKAIEKAQKKPEVKTQAASNPEYYKSLMGDL